MARVQKRKLSKKESKSLLRKTPVAGFGVETKISPTKVAIEKKIIQIPEIISVKEFADRGNLPVNQVISVLIKNGILATINQTIDFETAAIIGDDLNLSVVEEEKILQGSTNSQKNHYDQSANLAPRPPVVTIMGHVDHGKTTLLDKIREAKVAEGESGGITQHISAYQVKLETTKRKDLKNRTITFIDTPGHAAFSAMRQHGASITDLVVLIVAANDGVKPQTVEVIEQAKLNHVPLIVAINKVDLPEADPMRVKQQLSEYDLVPEEWGGKTVMVEISAKTGQGLDDLLEIILLQTDIMDLKADPTAKAIGVIIESHMEKGRGASASVLIENGTIHEGEPIAIGSAYGRIRILEDYTSKRVQSAGPSFPIGIAGLRTLPGFGDRLVVFETEKEAKESASVAGKIQSTLRIVTAKRVGEQAESDSKRKIEFNLVIKSDVGGSLEAIKKLISEVRHDEIAVKIVSEGVGPISESDITLAKATKSQVFGFRVPILMAAKKIAETEKIEIKQFDIIYELIDDLKVSLSALLPPEIIEEEKGQAKILAIFRDDRKAFVAGGRVESGEIKVGDEVKILQDNNVKYKAKILSLRQEKSEVKQCSTGSECGFGLPSGANVAVGDSLVAFLTIRKKRFVE